MSGQTRCVEFVFSELSLALASCAPVPIGSKQLMVFMFIKTQLGNRNA